MWNATTRKCFLLLLLLSTGFLATTASPTGAVFKQLSSIIKWTRTSSSKSSQTDGSVLQFENGYLVETVVQGNKLGVEPYTIRVSPEGELFAVDSVNSNIVRITPPLSQYSRARLVAGSFQGYSGHVDGKPSDARFNHPKGVAMDEKGNVYVADTSNRAIRKIGEAGVTTIAGGNSDVSGYRDGPSEDAKFSNDFDIVYVGSTCSLLVIDRGNAALRQISLQQQDCDYQYNSISVSDIAMVVGAVLVGYASFFFQHGFGASLFSNGKEDMLSEFKDRSSSKKMPPLRVEPLVEDTDAGWPSMGRLLSDLPTLLFQVFGSALLYVMPRSTLSWKWSKSNLILPQDVSENSLMDKHKLKSKPTPMPFPDTSVCPPPDSASGMKFKSLNPQKISKQQQQQQQQQSMYKEQSTPTSLPTRRTSKRQEFAQFYGSGENIQVGSKSHGHRERERERSIVRHRLLRDIGGGEAKSVELMKSSANYGSTSKFDHFNPRKFATDDGMRF